MIWYLMMSCGTKYQILGNALSNIGFVSKSRNSKIVQVNGVNGKQDISLKELIDLIKIHQHLQKYKRQKHF